MLLPDLEVLRPTEKETCCILYKSIYSLAEGQTVKRPLSMEDQQMNK